MSRSVLVMGLGAAAVALALVPGPATAAPTDGSLQGLVLSGTCGGGDLKKIILAPRSPNLFAPIRIIGPDFEQTRMVLAPYTVQLSDEGLKSRHLGPEVYMRPGKAPKNPVTCELDGATKEDGPFQVTITGRVLGP